MKLASRIVVSAATFLLTVGSAAAMTAVAVVDLNVRTGPGVQYPVIAVIPQGDVADAQNCGGGWCQVTYRGNMGWASEAYLNLVADGYNTGTYYGGYYPFGWGWGWGYTWPYYNNYYYGGTYYPNYGTYYPNRPSYYPNRPGYRPGRVDRLHPAPRTTLNPYRPGQGGMAVQRPRATAAPGLRAGGARMGGGAMRGGAMHGGGAMRGGGAMHGGGAPRKQ